VSERPDTTERFPRALPAAWGLLGVLFASALLLHEVTGYQAVLAAIALAATVLCLLSARASVVLFVGCQALDAYGFITHVPFSLSVARVVAVAVVGGVVLRWLLARPRPALQLRRQITVWDLGIGLFLAGAAISVPLSYSRPLSLVGIVHLTFLVGACFFLSRMALAEAPRRDLYTATIAVGSLSALVALGQAFVPDFFLEVMRPAEAVEGAASAVRASGFFDNPNTLALLLVLVVLFAAERVWSERRPLVRSLYAGAAVLSLAAIGVSESRAALVGIVVGGIALALLLIRSWRGRGVALVAMLLAFAAMLAIPGVGARAASIVDFRNDASAMDRIYLAEASWEMFVDHPVTGVGIQAFRAAYPDYADSRVTIDPVTDGHQMPLSVPAETGVLGLLAEVLLAGALAYLLVQSLRAGYDPLSPAGLAVMTAIAAMALFNTFIFFESFWIAVALVGADYVVAHRRATGGRA
jgi:O-antigen ligase